jgi:dihydrofolate reductase
MKEAPVFTIVAAMDEKRAIGFCGRLPWNVPEELAHFRKLTTPGALVMGRRTFEAIGNPLPDRDNFVVSRNMTETAGAVVCRTLSDALSRAAETGKPVYVIGGGEIFRQAFPLASSLEISVIKGVFAGDRFFPAISEAVWNLADETDFGSFVFRRYSRKPDAARVLSGTLRANLHPGMRVSIILKKDQKTGKRTEGMVQRLLTSKPEHTRGIKVMLADGSVGRVQEILES